MSYGTIIIIDHQESEGWPFGLCEVGDKVWAGRICVGEVEKVEPNRIYVRWGGRIEIGSFKSGREATHE